MKSIFKNFSDRLNRAKFILLIAFLLLIACSPLKQYQDLPEVKAWETDISKFEQLDKTESYPDDAIMFAGSSSIRLWKTLVTDMAPFNVIQRGFGGSRLSDLAVYSERIFSPHKCSALVLFVANDIIGGPNDKSPEEVRELFLYIVKTFRKTNPDAPVFWIAITPSSSRWKVWTEISRANDLIQQACEKGRKTYFIKTDFAFLTPAGVPNDDLFITDKLHLNTSGYQVWTKIIKTKIEEVLNH
jgi:lysophospholipase L1-like esterase